jgi:hypothetical protein
MKAYCSWCLEKTSPTLLAGLRVQRALYMCQKCGKKIVKCCAGEKKRSRLKY